MALSNSDLDLFLRAIADPARRRILLALKDNSEGSRDKKTGLSASDIEKRLKLAQPTVSHHMRILQQAGAVESRREGHWRRYRRNEIAIAAMMKGLKERL
jgi:DNA-binding transcriptional ArsR family regulator